jgi:hypothetical protein
MSIEYQCCFCSRGIEPTDQGAVVIIVRNLWEGEQSQNLFSHSQCVTERLASALAESVPFDVELLRD